MKLTDFFDQTQILNEGVRFTSREMNYVKKNAKNIYVAFEYEFNPIVEKMEALKQGESSKEKKKEEEPEREVISIDDVYDYEEYNERQSELEQEAFDEEYENRTDTFKKEKRDEFENDYHESIDMVGELGLASKFIDTKEYNDFSHINLNNYDVILQSMLDDELNDAGITKFIKYAEIIRNFVKAYNESDLSAVISDAYVKDIEYFADELIPHFSQYTPISVLLNTFSIDDFGIVQELLGEVADLDIPAFPDFSDRQQLPLYFKEYNKEAKKIAAQFDDIPLNDSSIKTITDFLDEVGLAGVDINQYIDNAIDRWVNQVFDEEVETIREETWQYIWDYADVRDNIDLDDIIQEIQRNHFVVVMSDDNEPYYEPDSGFTGSRTGSSNDNHKTYTTNFIKEYGHKWNISFNRDFESEVDIEGHGMIEYKSHPKPLNEALKLMHNMFACRCTH